MITFNDKTVLNATTRETKVIHRQNEIQRAMTKIVPALHEAMKTLEGKKICSYDGTGYRVFYNAIRKVELQRGIRIFPQFYSSIVGFKIDFSFFVSDVSVEYHERHFYIGTLEDQQTLSNVKDLEEILSKYQEKYSLSELKKAKEKHTKLIEQVSEVNTILSKYKF